MKMEQPCFWVSPLMGSQHTGRKAFIPEMHQGANQCRHTATYTVPKRFDLCSTKFASQKCKGNSAAVKHLIPQIKLTLGAGREKGKPLSLLILGYIFFRPKR